MKEFLHVITLPSLPFLELKSQEDKEEDADFATEWCLFWTYIGGRWNMQWFYDVVSQTDGWTARLVQIFKHKWTWVCFGQSHSFDGSWDCAECHSTTGMMNWFSRVILQGLVYNIWKFISVLKIVKDKVVSVLYQPSCHEDMGEWRYSSMYSYLGTRWRWVVSFIPWPLCPSERTSQNPLDGRLDGPQSFLGFDGERETFLPLPRIQTWLSNP